MNKKDNKGFKKIDKLSFDKNWELVNFCEFDKFAEQSYCLIHGVDKSLNLGDITKVDETGLKDFNLMIWGFPCQSISISGKQEGFIDKNGNKTRSGMYYEGIRILKYKKPAISIIENVKNLVSKKFKKEFEMILKDLDNAGYKSYWKVLNAKDFGVPQNRQRVFIVSIRKDLDNGQFKFPEGFDNGVRLKDILESEVDEKYYMSKEKVDKFLKVFKGLGDSKGNKNEVKQLGNIKEEKGKGWKNPQTGRIYSVEGCSPTLNTCSGGGHEPKILCGIDKSLNKTRQIDYANCLTASENRGISNRQAEGTAVMEIPDTSYCLDANYYKGTTPEQYIEKHRRQIIFEKEGMDLENIKIRKLTPRECFRLMGFEDKDYEKVKGKISDSQLYKQCGNSIVVDVVYYIFVELYKAIPYLFDDLKVGSYFSGIGAMEAALDRLYEDLENENKEG